MEQRFDPYLYGVPLQHPMFRHGLTATKSRKDRQKKKPTKTKKKKLPRKRKLKKNRF